MVRMVRQKKEWVCSECNTSHLTWQGLCINCGLGGTLQENILIAIKPKPVESTPGRRLRRRAKDSERSIAKRMLEADGADPAFKNIASASGRIGFITGMQVDAVSKSYVTENKNRKIPSWMVLAWKIINQKAVDFNKHALLHIEPPNMPRELLVNGVKKKLDTMAIITQSRHEDLIRSERALALILTNFEVNGGSSLSKEELQEVFQILHPHNT